MKIFINYRKEDTKDFVAMLSDKLCAVFGSENVFLDNSSISPGKTWQVELEQSVVLCDVVLAVIGNRWIECVDENGQRRIQSENDYVRFELETAHRHNKVVVPLFIKGTSHPHPEKLPKSIRWLVNRQAIELRGGGDFYEDAPKLVRELKRIDLQIEERRKRDRLAAENESTQASRDQIVCSQCKRVCASSDKYCQNCGELLWIECPECENPIPKTQRFCKACGEHVQEYLDGRAVLQGYKNRISELPRKTNPADRVVTAQILLREMEGFVPSTSGMEDLHVLKREVSKILQESVRESADNSFVKNHFQDALRRYRNLVEFESESNYAKSRIQEIETIHKRDLQSISTLVNEGKHRRALKRLEIFQKRFPDDLEARQLVNECENVLARISELVPGKLEKLWKKKQISELERELKWLLDHHVRLHDLRSKIASVRAKLKSADEQCEVAQSELDKGHVSRARLIAESIVKNISDHSGALQLLENTALIEKKIVRSINLCESNQFCAARRLLNELQEMGIQDQRLAQVSDEVDDELAGLDATIRTTFALQLVTFLIGVTASVSLKSWTNSLPGWGDPERWVFSLVLWLVMPFLVGLVMWMSMPNRKELLRRLCWRFLTFQDSISEDISSSSSSGSIPDVSGEMGAGPVADDMPGREPVEKHNESDADDHPEYYAEPDDDQEEETIPPLNTVHPRAYRRNKRDLPDPVDDALVDQTAALLECVFIGGGIFAISCLIGNMVWQSIIKMRFGFDQEEHQSMMSVLSPLSLMIPLIAMSLFSSILNMSSVWKRMLLVGTVVTGLSASLVVFTPHKISVQTLAMIPFAISALTILILSTAVESRQTFWKEFSNVFLACFFGGLVFSAFALPLVLAVTSFGLLDIPLEMGKIRDLLFVNKITPETMEIAAETMEKIDLIFMSIINVMVFLLLRSPRRIMIASIGADNPVIRGSLAIGGSWGVALFMVFAVLACNNSFKVEFVYLAKWVLLWAGGLVFPLMLCGMEGFRNFRYWILILSLLGVILPFLGWLIPYFLPIFAGAMFAYSATALLNARTVDVFEHSRAVLTELRIRNKRRVNEVRKYFTQVDI